MGERDRHKIDWMLIANYISRTISEFDYLRLQNWLKNDPERRRFLEHAQHYYSREDFPLPDEEQIDRIWKEFYGRMKQKQERRLWRRIERVAAVAILLIGSVCAWKMYPHSSDMQAQQPILAGNSQAVLILSDGSSVTLEDDGMERTVTDQDIQIN